MIRLYLMDTLVWKLLRRNRRMAAGAFFFPLLLFHAASPLEKVETRYADGPVKERYFIYKNDSGVSIKDSIYREFHPNGKVKTEIRYHDGQEEGAVRTWYSDGTPELNCHYSNGKLDGERTGWHPNNRVKCKSRWSKGKQEGISETWFENGRLKTRGSYCSGKRCSEFRTWYENGQLHSMVSFNDGYLNGPAKWYHANGELAIVGYHGEYGDREFLWQLYGDNGEKCAKITYSRGIVRKKEYYAPDSVIDAMLKTVENHLEK
jgi:antitoxin component YwqK of YwqJK toxin-antitoxin module